MESGIVFSKAATTKDGFTMYKFKIPPKFGTIIWLVKTGTKTYTSKNVFYEDGKSFHYQIVLTNGALVPNRFLDGKIIKY